MYDDDENMEMLVQVLERAHEQSAQCERGVFALRSDGRAGMAMIGPNCIQYAELLHPAVPPFEMCLN
jgi:hypothetical protein